MKCSWIESRISIETDGWTRPCCLETNVSAKINHISNGIINSFNDSKLLDLRKNLETGFNKNTRQFCYRCEQLESKNQQSLRTSTPLDIIDNRQLNYIQFKNSNKCQLACAHCGPDRSSTWAKIRKIKPHVKTAFEITDSFIDELINILPQIKVLKFSGGEPFLDPDHWEILNRVKHIDRQHCELHYITNGLVKPNYNLWKGWKSINCSISVDGFEDSYEWFRRGANWKELLDNIKLLENFCQISINYSITPYTIGDYNLAKSFWKYPFGGFSIVYPEHCSLFKFPLSYIKQLDNWQDIPFVNSCSNNNDQHINMYRLWAKKSDILWNTVGKAESLFWWVK